MKEQTLNKLNDILFRAKPPLTSMSKNANTYFDFIALRDAACFLYQEVWKSILARSEWQIVTLFSSIT